MEIMDEAHALSVHAKVYGTGGLQDRWVHAVEAGRPAHLGAPRDRGRAKIGDDTVAIARALRRDGGLANVQRIAKLIERYLADALPGIGALTEEERAAGARRVCPCRPPNPSAPRCRRASASGGDAPLTRSIPPAHRHVASRCFAICLMMFHPALRSPDEPAIGNVRPDGERILRCLPPGTMVNPSRSAARIALRASLGAVSRSSAPHPPPIPPMPAARRGTAKSRCRSPVSRHRPSPVRLRTPMPQRFPVFRPQSRYSPSSSSQSPLSARGMRACNWIIGIRMCSVTV